MLKDNVQSELFVELSNKQQQFVAGGYGPDYGNWYGGGWPGGNWYGGGWPGGSNWYGSGWPGGSWRGGNGYWG